MLALWIPWFDTLPVPERNMLEWAFVLGIAGCLLLFGSGICVGYWLCGVRYRRTVKKYVRRLRARSVTIGVTPRVSK